MKLEDALKTGNFKDQRHKASLNIMFTSYWLRNHVNGTLKEFGLSSEQFNVMRILKGKSPEQMCVKDIGSRMIEKNSNVPRILDKLVEKKLVKRTISKQDKRETLCTLSEKGSGLLADVNIAVDKISNEIMGLTNEEAGQLNELLEKMRITD